MTWDAEDRAEARRELSAAVAAYGSVDAVAELAAAWAKRLLGADGATVTRIDGDTYVYRTAVGRFLQLRGRRNPIRGSFTGRIILDGEPLLFAPELAPEASANRAETDRIRSGAVAPILLAGQAVGTLGVASHEDAAFDAADLELLVDLASFITAGLSRDL